MLRRSKREAQGLSVGMTPEIWIKGNDLLCKEKEDMKKVGLINCGLCKGGNGNRREAAARTLQYLPKSIKLPK